MRGRFKLEPLRPGDDGTRQTVRRMTEVAGQALTVPLVRGTALEIVRDAPPKDQVAQVSEIRKFLQEHVRFCADPLGVEWLHSPTQLLLNISQRYYVLADCDDVATLGVALGGAIGIPSRFVVLGFYDPQGPMGHIYAELFAGGKWLDLDTTRVGSEFDRVRSVARQWTVPALGF